MPRKRIKVSKDEFGITNGYKDGSNHWHPTSVKTKNAFLKAMRVPDKLSDAPKPKRTTSKCFLPKKKKQWGWAIQLYAVRSEQSWGIGDLGDLAEFARWSRHSLGADFILINPINAALPGLPQESSPYSPSSRVFKNPLYLRIEDVPGWDASNKILARLASKGHTLNRDRIINRDEVFRLKMAALKLLWKSLKPVPQFEKFSAAGGILLEKFATFCVLFETYGAGWKKWPAAFRSPTSPGIKSFQKKHSDRIAFYQWLQWLLDAQFKAAGELISLIQDLPIGVNPDGADAWIWQDLFAKDVSVGAPPDGFNTLGQNWGLQPFIPHKLRAANFEPFRATIIAALKYSGGLRIDHVMGLFRLYWIPNGASAKEGAYVRYPVEELLEILAKESRRAKAVVIGEDLGTVELGVRAKLHRKNILSYRVLWFEDKTVKGISPLAMSAVTTHDLPTVAGLWSGSDFAELKRLGLRPNQSGTNKLVGRLQKRTGLGPEVSLEQAVRKIYQLLAKSTSRLLSVTLDDALLVPERPNIPGTTTERPNWSLALPRTLEFIQRDAFTRELTDILIRR